MFDGARLGHEGIVYRRVRAAPENRTPRLSGAPGGAALRVRVVPRDAPSIDQTYNGFASVQSARVYVAKDLAADVVALLDSGATIERRSGAGTPVGAASICPGDVAVLVRTHADGELVLAGSMRPRCRSSVNGAGAC